MKTQEQLDIQTQVLKKQLEFYNLVNFILASMIIGGICWSIYKLVGVFI